MKSTGAHPKNIELVLRNRQRRRRIDLRQLRRIVRAILDHGLPPAADTARSRCEIGVHLVAADEMARLNRQFLRHDGSTDVITFEHDAAAETPPGESRMLGDIFVCVDEAIAQARGFRTSWQSELVRYLIHGVLHLRGFDDRKAAAGRVMKREEDRLLEKIAGDFVLKDLAK